MSITSMSRRKSRAFTLIELLVVIAIVILVSAVTLPVILPALASRQVVEGARTVQAALAGARDAAINANAPRGIRLVPDASLTLFDSSTLGSSLAANRIIQIEPAPDITDGFVTFPRNHIPGTTLGTYFPEDSNKFQIPPLFPFPFPQPSQRYAGYTDPHPSPFDATTNYRGRYPYPGRVLMIVQAVFQNNDPTMPFNPPTNWFWNVRIGDKFRFGNSGRYYTVVGPMTQGNAELFVNDGLPGAGPNYPYAVSSLNDGYALGAAIDNRNPEFLFLVNGIDDDQDGYVDNGIDGVDENTLGLPYSIIDDLHEWTETEAWYGSQVSQSKNQLINYSYTITRRPVPVSAASEVQLPSGAVIDLTTWDSTRERSRLPVDPITHEVDVMISQNGQVVPTTAYSSPSSAAMDTSFYHFWIADRTDVYIPGNTGSPYAPSLPIPPLPIDAVPDAPPTNTLKKDRQLVTLFTRTGQIVSNSIETFDFYKAFKSAGGYDTTVPFDAAQQAIREAK